MAEQLNVQRQDERVKDGNQGRFFRAEARASVTIERERSPTPKLSSNRQHRAHPAAFRCSLIHHNAAERHTRPCTRTHTHTNTCATGGTTGGHNSVLPGSTPTVCCTEAPKHQLDLVDVNVLGQNYINLAAMAGQKEGRKQGKKDLQQKYSVSLVKPHQGR